MNVKFGLEELNGNTYLYLEDKFRSKLFRRAFQEAKSFSDLVKYVGFSRTRLKETRKGKKLRKQKLEKVFMNSKLLKKLAELANFSFTEVEKNILCVKSGDSGKPIQTIFPIKACPEIAALVGHVTGDGHIDKNSKRFDYSNSNSILVTKVKNLVNKAIGEIEPTVSLLFRLNNKYQLSFPVSCLEVALAFSLNPKMMFGHCSEIKKADLYIRLRFPSIVGNVLKFFGSPVGKKTGKKFNVPAWIKNNAFDVKKEYIRALFDDEGHVKKQISLQMNKSKELREDGIKFLNFVKNMLKEMGIDCNHVYESEIEGKDSIKMTLCIMDQVSQRNFLQEIGFTHPNKLENLRNLVFTNHDKPRKRGKSKYIILQLLSKEPKTIKQLSNEIGISIATVRDHLYDLEQSGLVKRLINRTSFRYEGDVWSLANKEVKNYTIENLAKLKPHMHNKRKMINNEN